MIDCWAVQCLSVLNWTGGIPGISGERAVHRRGPDSIVHVYARRRWFRAARLRERAAPAPSHAPTALLLGRLSHRSCLLLFALVYAHQTARLLVLIRFSKQSIQLRALYLLYEYLFSAAVAAALCSSSASYRLGSFFEMPESNQKFYKS